jgi:hypothetical protein
MTQPKPFARLRELLEKATPGDWDNRCREFSNTERARHIWSNYGWIATFESPLDSAQADAELICELRNNAEKLLEALDLATSEMYAVRLFLINGEMAESKIAAANTLGQALIEIRALGGIK